MDVATIGSSNGTVVSLRDPTPYRAPRLGSGVLCPARNPEQPITRGAVDDFCESPLTSRMRGGTDSIGRPIAEYLCETCGTVFVAVTIGLDPRLRFDEVNSPEDDATERPNPVPSLLTALRRTERLPRPNQQAEMAVLEVCTQCGNIVRTDNGEWEAHALTHRED